MIDIYIIFQSSNVAGLDPSGGVFGDFYRGIVRISRDGQIAWIALAIDSPHVISSILARLQTETSGREKRVKPYKYDDRDS